MRLTLKQRAHLEKFAAATQRDRSEALRALGKAIEALLADHDEMKAVWDESEEVAS